MDVWRITVAAVRRWYVLLPLLALTYLAVQAVGAGVQPEYDATGIAMVVPGRSYPDIPNPFGNPEDAKNAVAIVLNGPEPRSQIEESGLVSNYEVDPVSGSTFLRVSVRADTPEAAIETGTAVFDLAAEELDDRQAAAGIPRNARFGIDVIQPTAVSAEVTEGKRRNMVVVGVIGAGLALLVTVFFDDVVGLLRRRRQRRKQEKEQRQAQDPGRTPQKQKQKKQSTVESPRLAVKTRSTKVGDPVPTERK